MTSVEMIFVLFSVLIAVAGIVLVAAATRAYLQTRHRVMLHLSVGFALIVAAAVSTAFGVHFNHFENVNTLLVVNNGFSMCGYLFVVYSVVSYT
jgi:hypothetical protein